MPGRVRVHRPSPEKEGEYKMRILSILNESEEAMTIDEIKSQDMILQPLTSQKMARLIGNLIEMGLVRKGKSKSLGRMVYKAVAVMISQGYDVNEEEEKDMAYFGLVTKLQNCRKDENSDRLYLADCFNEGVIVGPDMKTGDLVM